MHVGCGDVTAAWVTVTNSRASISSNIPLTFDLDAPTPALFLSPDIPLTLSFGCHLYISIRRSLSQLSIGPRWSFDVD